MSSKNRTLGAEPEQAKKFTGHQPGNHYLLSSSMMKLSQFGVAQDITSRTSCQALTHCSSAGSFKGSGRNAV
jgi:hypothetical protein